MKAPLHTPAPIGSVEELREFTAQSLALARIYAEHAEDLVLIGDDIGLEVTTRKLIAAVRAATATIADIRGRACTR